MRRTLADASDASNEADEQTAVRRISQLLYASQSRKRKIGESPMPLRMESLYAAGKPRPTWTHLSVIDLSHISFRGVEAPPLDVGAARRPTPRTGETERDPARARPAPPTPPPEPTMHPLMDWMLRRAGLDADAYRASAMQRRLPACLRQLRVDNPTAARELLERRPERLTFALSTILIGVSGFFRDPPVFDHLARATLPALLQRRPALRVCSVGSSAGHELYSVAMLLAEAGALGPADLLGLDCRADAITRARAGVFDADDLLGLGAARRERFFQADGGGSRLVARPELRTRLRWEQADILALVPEPRSRDLILFRNVSIYFNESHASVAWDRLAAALAPGGILVTGKAEKPPASLPFTRLAPSIYQKWPA